MEHSRRYREIFFLSSYRKQCLEPPLAVGRRSGNNARPSNKYKKAKHHQRHCFTASLLPRPVHMYLLRYTDKQYILWNAASALKDNPFLEANLYISDDVLKKVRDDQKKLKERYINEIRSWEEVDFAYIAWNVPAHILYKVKDSAKLKSFFLPDQWTWLYLFTFFSFNFLPCYAVAYLAVYLGALFYKF